MSNAINDNDIYSTEFIDGRIFVAVWLSLVGIFFLIAYLRAVRRNHSQFTTSFRDSVVDVSRNLRQREDEERLESDRTMLTDPPPIGIYTCEDKEYTITHKKSGRSISTGSSFKSNMNLVFLRSDTDDSVVSWAIRGCRPSLNGNFVILEGKVYASRRAYWVEKCGSELRVVAGEFCAQDSSVQQQTPTRFDGEWLSSSGTRGYFVHFHFRESAVVDVAIPVFPTTGAFTTMREDKEGQLCHDNFSDVM